jgi:hypothetical protein
MRKIGWAEIIKGVVFLAILYFLYSAAVNYADWAKEKEAARQAAQRGELPRVK